MTVLVDEQKIEELLNRSVDTIYPSREELKKKLLSGEVLKIYAGADATGASLHIGHSINYLMLKRFHELGHKVVVLVGDFTAMIGDPTDRSAARVRLSKAEVEENLKGFKSQISHILDFDDPKNPVEFVFNSSWLNSLTFEQIADIASQFTVQHMLKRDMFEKRMKEEKPLFVHEFFYPLLQGYDSVAMEVDIEVGGTDQTFNMLAGRTLARRYLEKEKFVMTHPLLDNMSKSSGKGIMLDDASEVMYLKVMELPDEAIEEVYTHCTTLTLSEIKARVETMRENESYRDSKMELARTIVEMYHGSAKALEAEESFVAAFQEGGMPSDALVLELAEGSFLADALVEHGVLASKSEFRRLVEAGAIKDVSTGEQLADYNYRVVNKASLRVGKKRFVALTIKT